MICNKWRQENNADRQCDISAIISINGLVKSTLVQMWAGTFSPLISFSKVQKEVLTLSIFIDESGDFGEYSYHSPYYIISLLFHDQEVDINTQIKHLRQHVKNAGFEETHALHSGPLIRREKDYIDLDLNKRRSLFRYLLTFFRLCDVEYKTFVYEKKHLKNRDAMVSRMSRDIGAFVRDNLQFFQKFDSIIVYYDGGQREITNIINAVFNAFLDAEIRKVKPSDYKLFQAVDMACTIELLRLKYETNSLSTSELKFFRGRRNLYKNNIKAIVVKRFKDVSNSS